MRIILKEHIKIEKTPRKCIKAVADPGFLRWGGGGANFQGGDRFLPSFFHKLHGNEKIWTRGVGKRASPAHPLRSATAKNDISVADLGVRRTSTRTLKNLHFHAGLSLTYRRALLSENTQISFNFIQFL